MSIVQRITELGNAILQQIRDLGLENADNFNPGLSSTQIAGNSMFAKFASPSEFEALYMWRDGSAGGSTPMGSLWLIPGHYMLCASEAADENQMFCGSTPGWSKNWYSFLSDGSSTRHFCDVSKSINSRQSVYCFDPEFFPSVAKKYDSIESMLRTVAECYKSRAYFTDIERVLTSESRLEAEIAARLNPTSDYWQRPDLF